MSYTSKDVRKQLNPSWTHEPTVRKMLTAFADLLTQREADESAVPFGYIYEAPHEDAWFEYAADRWPRGESGKLVSHTETPLFTHPPAQAAQVDALDTAVGWLDMCGGSVGDVVDRLAAEPVAQHPDDHHVEMFADDMKRKLYAARSKGRGGWDGDEPGMQRRLSGMLRDHVEKGDPCDVANFAMFLHQRGESILPAEPVAQGEAESVLVRTAPEQIYLQIDDDGDYSESEPFPADHAEITWCTDSVVSCEVKYIRADLVAQPRAPDEDEDKDITGGIDAHLAQPAQSVDVTGGYPCPHATKTRCMWAAWRDRAALTPPEHPE